jgi:hypothetical protein
VSPELAARLETLNIQWTVNEAGYAAFTRGDLIAMARSGAGGRIASLGSTGIMTDNGLAYLSWREGQPVLAAHGGKVTLATAEQVEAVRQFSDELKTALAFEE